MGEKIPFKGMQRKKELEEKSGQLKGILPRRGNVTVRFDCGKQVLVFTT